MSRLDVWNESIKDTEFRWCDEANLDMLLRRVSRPQKIGRNGVFVRIAGEKVWYYGKETILHIGEQVYVRYDPANPLSVRVYAMETDKYLWTWELANELMVPYLTKNKDDIANAERIANENKRVIKQFAKGMIEAVDPDKQIDILALMVQRGLEGKEKFKPELPTKFVPVFSEEQIEQNPELSNITEIKLILERMNLTVQAQKGI